MVEVMRRFQVAQAMITGKRFGSYRYLRKSTFSGGEFYMNFS